MSFASIARSCIAVSGRRCPAARVSGGSATATMRRRMGGGQPVSRSMEAELWQGHPKEPEGWETTVYLVYGGTAVMLALALGFAPDTSIKTVRPRRALRVCDCWFGVRVSYAIQSNNSPCFISQWASTEARARLELQAEGKLDTPVFGVHYNSQKGNELESVWDEVSFARQDGQARKILAYIIFICCFHLQVRIQVSKARGGR